MPVTWQHARPPASVEELSRIATECYACDVWHHRDAVSDYRVRSDGRIVIAGSWEDTMFSDEYDSDYDDYDDEYGEYGEGIHGYGFKPTPVFHGQGPRFLGLELELESNGSRSLSRTAELTQEHLGSLGYLKEDGSLCSGFEMVTHPMTYTWALNNFPWEVFDVLDSRMVADSSCGIHVHVDRRAFTDHKHLYRWLRLIHRNKELVQRVARRDSSSYARWNDHERRRVLDYVKGDRSSERYTILNMQNRATIEVRAFASTTRPDDVKAALGLVDASVRYAGEVTNTDVIKHGAWSADAFTFWVNRDPIYAPLAAAIAG